MKIKATRLTADGNIIVKLYIYATVCGAEGKRFQEV